VGVENLNFSVDTQEELDLARAIDARLPAGHLKYALETTLEAWARVQEASAARDELVRQAQELNMGYEKPIILEQK
jgi:hypothetical protein